MVVVVELSAGDNILEGEGQTLGSIQAGLGGGLGERGQLLALLQLCRRRDYPVGLDLGAGTNHNLWIQLPVRIITNVSSAMEGRVKIF